MKKIILSIFCIVLMSCESKTDLQKEFDCKATPFSNLEMVSDMKNQFTAQIPKHWKTNLFYDSVQSSIYTADTIKQLTETTILDFTYVTQSIKFDSIFKNNLLEKHKENQLNVVKHIPLKVQKKEAILDIAKGRKGKYAYQVANLFIKINNTNFMHLKTEIYGDSLVENRMCEAINLIEKIQIK